MNVHYLMHSSCWRKRMLIFFMVPLFVFGTLDAKAAVSHDEEIVAVFDQLNAQDIVLASLAVTRGTTDAVRAVGRMILNDHIPLLDDLRDLARKQDMDYRVDYSNAYARAHKQILVSLVEKAGRSFDQEYLASEVAFSKEFIVVVEKQLLPKARSTALKKYLSSALEDFRLHLSHIEHAMETLSGNLEHEHHEGMGHDH